MMKLIQTIIGIGLWLSFVVCPKVSAQGAADLLDKAAAKYEHSNGISATFELRTKTPTQPAGDRMEGKIEMRGEKFVLETADVKTWFDGTTQWSYVENNEEVNVSNPTGDELKMTNPVLLLSSYQKGFKATYKGESTATNGKSVFDIELTPKKKSDIEKVELQIEKYASLPARISIVSKNGVTTTIEISKIKTGVNQADSFFVFNEADYPDVEVIDLR